MFLLIIKRPESMRFSKLTKIIKVSENYFLKSSLNSLKIPTASPKAYRKVIHRLKDNHTRFHTYTRRGEKSFRILIKNILPATSTDVIKKRNRRNWFHYSPNN